MAELNPDLKAHMLDYKIALMEYANDFSWSSAKASHVVLLCRMVHLQSGATVNDITNGSKRGKNIPETVKLEKII